MSCMFVIAMKLQQVTTGILAGRDGCEPMHFGSARSRDTSVTWQDPDKWLGSFTKNKLAFKNRNKINKLTKRIEKMQKKLVSDMASVVGSSSGVIVGIAYIAAIIVITCVVVELLYLKTISMQKKKQRKCQPLVMMAGAVVIEVIGIVYNKNINI